MGREGGDAGMTQQLSGWERWLEAPYALDLIGWAREVHDAEGYLSLRIEDRWWTWLPGPDRIWGPFAASPEAVRGWDVPRLLGVPLERIARELGGQWTVTSTAYATLWEGGRSATPCR